VWDVGSLFNMSRQVIDATPDDHVSAGERQLVGTEREVNHAGQRRTSQVPAWHGSEKTPSVAA
jgi:hypothetical protein